MLILYHSLQLSEYIYIFRLENTKSTLPEEKQQRKKRTAKIVTGKVIRRDHGTNMFGISDIALSYSKLLIKTDLYVDYFQLTIYSRHVCNTIIIYLS